MIDFLDAFNRNLETYAYGFVAALLVLHAGCVACEAVVEWHRKRTKRAEAMDAALHAWLSKSAGARGSNVKRRSQSHSNRSQAR